MKNRNIVLDITKGLTLLVMPAVHSSMFYVSAQFWHYPFYRFLNFMAQWPGAQIFLFIQGFYIGKPRMLTSLWQRFIWLAIVALIINILKGSLPVFFSIFPISLFQQYQTDKQHAALRFLYMGDILHCAALLQLWGILIHVLGRVPKSIPYLVGLSIIITLLVNTYSIRDDSLSLRAFFTGKAPYVFFPFFPWAVYGMFGYMLGYTKNTMLFIVNIIHCYSLKNPIKHLLLLSTLLFLFPLLCNRYEYNFYQPSSLMVILHCLFIVIWIGFIHTVCIAVPSKWRMDHFWQFLSKHITLFYAIQWMVVIYCLPIWKFQKLDGKIGIMVAVFNSLCCVVLLFAIITVQKKYLKIRIYEKTNI